MTTAETRTGREVRDDLGHPPLVFECWPPCRFSCRSLIEFLEHKRSHARYLPTYKALKFSGRAP